MQNYSNLDIYAIVPFGHPIVEPKPHDRYDETRIHFERY
jgi:hypothetical protein